MIVNFENKEFEFNTWEDAAVFLRTSKRLSYRDIRDAVNGVVSYQTIASYLDSQGLSGNIEYPELGIPETYFNRTDIEIAKELGVPESKVILARRALGLQKKTHSVSIYNRRRLLVQSMFGKKYLPGKNLASFMVPKMSNNLIDYYIKGRIVDWKISSDRVYRMQKKMVLKDKILKEFSITQLIKMEVIKNGSNTKG